MRLLTRLLEPKAIAHAHCDLPCGVYAVSYTHLTLPTIYSV